MSKWLVGIEVLSIANLLAETVSLLINRQEEAEITAFIASICLILTLVVYFFPTGEVKQDLLLTSGWYQAFFISIISF